MLPFFWDLVPNTDASELAASEALHFFLQLGLSPT